MTISTSPKLRRRETGSDLGTLDLVDITMDARASPAYRDHEQIVRARDPASGLHALIAIHDRTLGAALGGCRMWTYAAEADALTDVLQLSRGMTLKAAVAGLNLGGGKAVILGDPRRDKSEALFRSFGCAVDGLGGRYITAEDVGTSVREMDWVARETPHVVGTSRTGNDPSPVTALGVLEGIRAAVRHRLRRDRIAGLRVAVQGLGHVGAALCRLLVGEGARLVVADIQPDRAARIAGACGAIPTAPEAIYDAEAEVFAPCALGGALNDGTIPRLRCAIVAGSANNQLAERRHGEALRRRGILYAPDYVINAGGLIRVAMELVGGDPGGERTRARLRDIGCVLAKIYRRADAEGVATNFIAERLALERIVCRKRESTGEAIWKTS